MRPATMVGSANGKSMRALSADWPGKLSLTSVQAIKVPKTTLISATRTEQTRLNSSAASAPGTVTVCQKPAGPKAVARVTIAANGSKTITLRYVRKMPGTRYSPPRRLFVAAPASVTNARETALTACTAKAQILFYLCDQARIRIEKLLINVFPTA